MGQIVPFVKDILSPALWAQSEDNGGMSDAPTAEQMIVALQDRMRALRRARKWTQKEMASAMNVEMETYKKWEKRPNSTLPIYLAPRFAMMVGCDLEYLITGSGRAPTKPSADEIGGAFLNRSGKAGVANRKTA